MSTSTSYSILVEAVVRQQIETDSIMCSLNYSGDGRGTPHYERGGYLELINALFENPDSNINLQDEDGNTPLHQAAKG